MSRRRLAAALSVGLLSPALLALSAGATVSSTTITGYSYPTHVLVSGSYVDLLAGFADFTPLVVRGAAPGATPGSDGVFPACYHGTTPVSSLLHDDSDTTDVKADDTYTTQATEPAVGRVCDIRVLDAAAAANFSADAPSGAAANAYALAPTRTAFALSTDFPEIRGAGPNINGSYLHLGSFPDFGGASGYISPGFGGLGSTLGSGAATLTDSSLASSGEEYQSAAALDLGSSIGNAAATVDGTNVVLPVQIVALWGGDPDQPAVPGESVANTYDTATGDAVVTLTDALQRCATPATQPITKTSCASVTSAGVTLVRTMTFTASGRQQSVTDAFVSSDNASHSVLVRYLDRLGAATSTTADQPSWSGGGPFGQPAPGSALPAASTSPPTYTIHTQDSGPVAFAKPSLALTLSALPTTSRFDQDDYPNDLRLSYTRAVTADTPGVVTQTVSGGESDGESQARAVATRAGNAAHVVLDAIAPVRATRSVTLHGHVTAGGNGYPGRVTIGTTSVPVASDGTFTTTQLIAKPKVPTGFVAMGSDSSGAVAASNTVTTTWVVPVQGASAKITQGKIKVSATCAASAVGGCVAPITVSNKNKTVASGTLKLAAGKKGSITLSLNSVGKGRVSKLKPGKYLTIKVVVASKDPSGVLTSVKTSSLKRYSLKA